MLDLRATILCVAATWLLSGCQGEGFGAGLGPSEAGGSEAAGDETPGSEASDAASDADEMAGSGDGGLDASGGQQTGGTDSGQTDSGEAETLAETSGGEVESSEVDAGSGVEDDTGVEELGSDGQGDDELGDDELGDDEQGDDEQGDDGADGEDETDGNSWTLAWEDGGSTPRVGKPGDADLIRLHCPDGELLVGFEGHQLAMVRRLRPICARVRYRAGAAYLESSEAHSIEAIGKESGQAFTRRCPDDHVIVGAGGQAAALVDRLAFHCARLKIAGDAGWPEVKRGEIVELEAVGGPGGVVFDDLRCGDSSGAAGIVASHHIDSVTSLSFECQRGWFE